MIKHNQPVNMHPTAIQEREEDRAAIRRHSLSCLVIALVSVAVMVFVPLPLPLQCFAAFGLLGFGSALGWPIHYFTDRRQRRRDAFYKALLKT
jgi:hypothetical protein